jgi:hypothetical protein
MQDYNDPLSVQAESAKANLLRARQGQEYKTQQGPGMVGRVYVGAHPLQGLAEVLRTRQAANQEDIYTQELKDIGAQRQKALVEGLRTFNDTYMGSPAVASTKTSASIPSFDDADAQAMQSNVGNYSAVTGGQAAVKGNPLAAISNLAGSQNPMLAQAGVGMLAQYPQQREAALQRAAEKEEDRKFRAEDKERDRVARENNIRLTAQLTAANRPEKMVTVLGPNGEAISLPQSQAGGMQMYNPTAAKDIQKQRTQGKAKEDLSGVVQQLNNAYDSLDQGGGIVSTEKGGLSNILSRAGSTGVGQAIGGALGTENQKQRQFIEQTRPLLLNFIKEATGMSAQQMNSNAEMQLYLKAATDPTLSVQANRDALANLDKMFGLGLAKPSGAAKPAVPTAGGNIDSLLDKYK